MRIEDELKNLGLKGSEIRVYLYLLERGSSSPAQIAKGTNIARTNTYHVLKSLIEKSLVAQEKKGERYIYLPTNPESLLRTLELQKELVSRLLPDLRALHKAQVNKPSIRFIAGVDGVKELFMQMLEAEEIHGMASTRKLFALDPKFFASYTTLMKKRGIIFYDLLSHASGGDAAKATKDIMGALYEYKLLLPKYGEVNTNILIWNDHVALMTLEEPIFGTLITNSHLAATFKTIFKIIWDSIERLAP